MKDTKDKDQNYHCIDIGMKTEISTDNKTIQGLWIGKRLSLMEQLSIKSFLNHNHSYHLYVYQKVSDIPEGVILRNANEILPEQMIFKHKKGFAVGSYSGFSNLFRYKLLFDKGGIWTDLDVVCLRPFEFRSEYLFASEYISEKKVKIHTGVIKAPPGSECIKMCYEEAKGMDFKTLSWGQTGADLLISFIKKFNLESFVVPPGVLCPISYWEFEKFVEPNFDFKIPEETYGIHLWNEMWRRNSKKLKNNKIFGKPKFDKTILYTPETLYGRLQRMYL